MHVGIFNKVYSQTFPDRSIKKTTEATKQYVLGLLSFVVTGAFPWIQNAAGLEVYKSYGINSSISYVISQIMFGVIGEKLNWRVIRKADEVGNTLMEIDVIARNRRRERPILQRLLSFATRF